MSSMVKVSLDALDSLDRRLALLPAAVGVVAGLLLPNPMMTALQVQLGAAALMASVVAIGLALVGIAGRETSIGHDPAGLTARFSDPTPAFYVDAAGPFTETLEALAKLTTSKARYLNLALVAAASGMVLFLAVRILSVS
jgi:hypothetical protein